MQNEPHRDICIIENDETGFVIQQMERVEIMTSFTAEVFQNAGRLRAGLAALEQRVRTSPASIRD